MTQVEKKIDMGDEGVDIVDKLQGSYDLAMESCTSALDPFGYLLEAKREIERLRTRVTQLEMEKKYLIDDLYPLLDALRDLPVLPSPDVLLTLSHAAKYPEDWETGKFLQRERGLRAVPPKTECELGAGWWNRVVNRPVPR